MLELRGRQQRNLLATLLLSQGVPMLLSGDEIGRTQHGNNNAYALDNELSWVDWDSVDVDLLEFTRRLVQLRRSNPVLHRRQFLSGGPAEGEELPDVAWFSAAGQEMTPDDWDNGNRSVILWLNGDMDDVGPRGESIMGATLMVCCNPGAGSIEWKLPPARWGRTVACRAGHSTSGTPEAVRRPAGGALTVMGRSVMVLEQL